MAAETRWTFHDEVDGDGYDIAIALDDAQHTFEIREHRWGQTEHGRFDEVQTTTGSWQLQDGALILTVSESSTRLNDGEPKPSKPAADVITIAADAPTYRKLPLTPA